jgi:hypothetical protein
VPSITCQSVQALPTEDERLRIRVLRRHATIIGWISRVIGEPERSGLSRIEKGTSARDICFGHTDLDGAEAVDGETVRVP